LLKYINSARTTARLQLSNQEQNCKVITSCSKLTTRPRLGTIICWNF